MIAKKNITLLLPFALFLLPSIAALAQSQTTGGIAGTVKDRTGAVIAGAEVMVTSRATGDARKIPTDDVGAFSATFLAPGEYRVTVTSNGFKKWVLDNVKVVITETATVEADLQVGALSEETVNISSVSPLLHRQAAQLAPPLHSRPVSQFPLP